MTIVKSVTNAEHYSWGDNCDGWHLLKSDHLSVIEERMPPGSSEQQHFHNQSQQLFYILSGAATFTVEGQEIIVKANESIHIPAKTKHCIANQTKEDLNFLVISEPESHGDRINL
jgi:mannose-6-phosphate isomerase-like protein (cupin superfamily)